MDANLPDSRIKIPIAGALHVPDHRLISIIGGGSYGQIWLGQNVMGAYRAIKVVSRAQFHSDRPYEREFEGLQRFEPISRLHEGFVQILHVGRNDGDGYFYYVMELGDSQDEAWREDPARYSPRTLHSEISQARRIPLDRCMVVGLALSAALSRLHQQKLVHRDLKPANVVFVDGHPKLADIGLVTEAGPGATFVGTEGYVPREGPGEATADIFALGKLLYEISTGRDCTDFPLLPEDPPEPVGHVSFAELNEVVCKCCEADPARRYQSAEDVRLHLSLLQAGRSVRRLLRLERGLGALQRWAIPATAIFVALATILFLSWRANVRDTELLQRKSGYFVASGNEAMESGDYSEALPWFTAALALFDKDPRVAETHRLRTRAVLDRSPRVVQMWFGDQEARYSEFNADGSAVLAPVGKGTFELKRLSDGSSLSRIFGSGRAEEMAVLNPQGNQVMTSSRLESVVRLWPIEGSAGPTEISLPNYVVFARFSPDGNRLVACLAKGRGDATSTAVVWDLRTGRMLRLAGHALRILHATFDHSGARVLTCSEEGDAKVWDAQSGLELARFTRHQSWVNWGAFSPDGSRVATASFDHTVRIWDVSTGQESLPQPLQDDVGVRSVEFSPDGNTLVAADFNFSVRFWDSRTGRRALAPLHHPDHVVYAAFSPDSKRVISVCQDGTTRVWMFPQPEAPRSWPATDLRAEQGWVASVTHGRAEIVCLPQPSTVHSLPADSQHGVEQLLFAGDSGYALLCSSNFLEGDRWIKRCQQVRVSDGVLAGEPVDISGNFHSLLALGSKNLLLCRSTNQVTLVDLSTGRERWSVDLKERRPRLMVADRAQRQLALVHGDKQGESVDLLAIEDGRPLLSHSLHHDAEVKGMEFSPKGDILAVACASPVARAEAAFLWNTVSGKLVGPPLHHRDGVLCARFSPEGSRLVTAGEDFNAIVWDVATGQQAVRPMVHHDQVVWAEFSPDARWVVTACRDNSVRLWDAVGGDPVTPAISLRDPPRRVQFSRRGDAVWVLDAAQRATYLPMERDHRPVEDLQAIASLLSARAYHETGALMPSPRDTLRASWNRIREKYPEEFSTGK